MQLTVERTPLMIKQLRLVIFLLALTLIGTPWIFWINEYGVNPSVRTYNDALWWWFVSSTTVGYGDIAPVTNTGRIAGVFTILIGIYCYTNFITITGQSLHGVTNRRQLGTAQVKARGHIVICDYTAFADELLQVLDRHPALREREVVIVTDLVQVTPYPQHHFVRGVPISPAALQLANLTEAAFIFVFANIRFQDPDLKTLHTVSRIRKINPRARIFIELAHPESELLSHLGDNITVISSRDLLTSVLKNEALDLSSYFPAV